MSISHIWYKGIVHNWSDFALHPKGDTCPCLGVGDAASTQWVEVRVAVHVYLCVLSHVQLFATPWTLQWLLHCNEILYCSAIREAHKSTIFQYTIKIKFKK